MADEELEFTIPGMYVVNPITREPTNELRKFTRAADGTFVPVKPTEKVKENGET